MLLGFVCVGALARVEAQQVHQGDAEATVRPAVPVALSGPMRVASAAVASAASLKTRGICARPLAGCVNSERRELLARVVSSRLTDSPQSDDVRFDIPRGLIEAPHES